ncbi:YcjX family protein [Pseudoalteromonas sp. SSM20]|uniref:YcjX family protein n=1 Tax=Pseudoalteromonas sp. SSM20 TaxID=3139394 RepID=UPI003BABEFF0
MQKLRAKATKLVKRGLDQHVKLAVTGLSKSGKTAFITSLIHHLTNAKSQMPFFSLQQQERFIAGKLVGQDDLSVATFDYVHALSELQAGRWPESTNRLNTLRLNLKYKPSSGLRSHLTDVATLTIDIFDYPGEWLLDLPMLDESFIEWNNRQFALLKKSPRYPHSEAFLAKLNQFDWTQEVDYSQLKALALEYRDLLLLFKNQCQLTELQPGRLIMPGELEDAPITLFFPVKTIDHQTLANAPENSYLFTLKQRFEQYKKDVVKTFYSNFFGGFDRQIILVDLLGALDKGRDALVEQSDVLKSLLKHFDYGKSGFLSRLFSPKIDKILFAANKVDHLSVEHHKDLALLLNNLILDAQNDLNYQGVTVETMAMSSVKATKQVKVTENGQVLNCIFGKSVDSEQLLTYLPSQPPMRLLSEEQWPENGFSFPSFYPLLSKQNTLEHVRLDHAIEYLIGDKVL